MGFMIDLSLTSAAPAAATADALVVGAYRSDSGPVAAGPDGAAAVRLAATAGFLGQVGELLTLPAVPGLKAAKVLVVGLGSRDKMTAEDLRQAAGTASRAAAGCGTLFSTLSLLDLAPAAEGHLLGGYVFDAYKTPERPPVGAVRLAVAKTDKAAKAVLRRAVVVAEAVALARDLVNTAPNDLPPEVFAARATVAAQEAGLDVEVLDENALRDGGFGGILAVGSGSAWPPRLVRISYSPAGASTSVALVGKGITFDSGGLSIKPAQGMEAMTSDMSGAAAVVATVIAAAALELSVAVTCWVPLAENLPSGSAYRPGDVLRHYGGKTSHVLNTDAEGRLVLADAIARAAEDHPDYLLDTATLTGAQVVALGNRTMGVMGEPVLRDRVAELAREVGEGGWAMPLPPELREGIDSPLADIANINWDRVGGMLVAGHYLAEFVPDGLPWAHLDVAGPAYHKGKPYGYQPTGATGVPVRTLLAVLTELAGR